MIINILMISGVISR